MFVPDFEKSIPGYTGHRQSVADEADDSQQQHDPRKQIPGELSELNIFKLFMQDTEVMFQELNLKMFMAKHTEKLVLHHLLKLSEEAWINQPILNTIPA